MKIDGKIETKKVGSSLRKLIGRKYVGNYLKTKYDLEIHQVYLEERRKAIKNSTKFLVKTANSINYYGNMSIQRGKLNARCPIYKQKEDWIHVMKCGNNGEERQFLIDQLEVVKYNDSDVVDRREVITSVIQFLKYYEGEEINIKTIFRG